METLIVVRHAKAESSYLHRNDFDRPLTWQGIDDARRAGQRLVDEYPSASVIVSSPAQRTTTTAEMIARAYGWDETRIIFDERIYEAETSTLLGLVEELKKHPGTVILVGHNPGVLELCYHLTKGAITTMPTCAVVPIPLS